MITAIRYLFREQAWLPPVSQTFESSKFDAGKIAGILLAALQLSAVFLLVRLFNIETASGISKVAPYVVAAFIIQSFLDVRHRIIVLLSLCLFIIYFAFGAFSGSFLIATSLSLIVASHLPIRFPLKVFIILLISAGVFILRADLFYAPRGSLVAPFIASMFMFRLIIYLYEIYHGLKPQSVLQTLCYFFLFPNICFLFFPILDYKIYIRSYWSMPEAQLWQKGIRWMLRGLIHILTYRLIYYYATISPSEVVDFSTLLQFTVTSYILVLRISGLFHFITGLLCMFGLNLPSTFDNYFLATSFIDQWRRINVYWRDFILKILYYPIIFRLKKFWPKFSLPLTMLLVFLISWLFHGYQWFWVRGYYVFSVMDFSFWLILGIFITANAMYLEKKKDQSSTEKIDLRRYMERMFRITGMMLFMSLLWSLWEGRSFNEWFYLLSKAQAGGWKQYLSFALITIAIIVAGVVIQFSLKKQQLATLINMPPQNTRWLTIPLLIILLGFAYPQTRTFLPDQAEMLVSSLTRERLNTNDQRTEEEGYYKTLIDGESNNPAGLWEVHLKRAKRYNKMDNIYVRTNDILTKVFKPNSRIQTDNFSLSTNSFGIRDRQYPIVPSPDVKRMAILGGSYEMGSKVNDDEVFEQIVENRLNDSLSLHKKQLEILNFACGGFYLIQHVELCKTKVFNYKPGVVMYFAHSGEHWRMSLTLTNLIRQGANLKYKYLEDLKSTLGLRQSMSKAEIEERLAPYLDDVIRWCYQEISAECRRNGAQPVWVFLPTTSDTPDASEFTKLENFAREFDFLPIDLRSVYGKMPMSEIIISAYDTHPNAKGHQLIAKALYDSLQKHPQLISGK